MSNSYVQVPPDGSGKKIYTNQQVVDGVTVQIQGVNIASGDDPTHLLNIDGMGTMYSRFYEGDPILGAYGDLKVLQEHILGVYEHTVDSYDDLFYIREISGGTSNYIINESSVLLSTTTDAGSRCSRTTNRFHYYQPGISFLVTMACSCSDTGVTNNKRQWGLFADSYGLFFELSGTTVNVVLRHNSTGPVTEIKVPQSEWNIDKLDGTGNSKITLNVSRSYQYFININYPNNLIYFGLYDAELGRIKCHEFYISGTYPYPFLRHASLPIQFNNENVGVTTTGTSLREIMAVVMTEGSADYTFWRFGDLGCSHRAVTTNTPILSVRPKIILDNGKHNHVNTFPESISVYSTGSTIRLNIVQHDGILSGATWLLDSVGGPLQGDNEATYIDMNDPSIYNFKSFFIQRDTPTNIDLTNIFELNDEGIVLGADNLTQFEMSFVATTLNGGTADVTMDLSYRALY